MLIASPFRDVEIPSLPLHDYVLGDIAAADLDRVAMIDTTTGVKTRFGELADLVTAFAGELVDRGIGAGDVVALHAPNSSAFAIAFYGILRAGAAATTVNTLSTADDISRQLRDTGARMLITVTTLLRSAGPAAAAAQLSEADVIVLDGTGADHCGQGNVNMDHLLGAGQAPPPFPIDSATHLAAILYSSGTAGSPKGVMLTHRNLVANVAQISPLMRGGIEEVLLAVLPFYSYGLTILLNAGLHTRSRLVIMESFGFKDFLANIQRHQCTQAFVSPPIMVALAKHSIVDSFDLSSMHTISSGAAPMDEEIANAVERRLNCQVIQAYGLTELSPASHGIPFDRGISSVGAIASLSSCGWTLPNSYSKIVDPVTGDEIPLPTEGLSEAGELWFKGPNVMAGYLNDEQATMDAIDRQGFLHTGDLARVNAHGCIFIVDRLKEVIKYRGNQVSPSELEALLSKHSEVADAAVIGVIDRLSGEEIPKAFVVRQPGRNPSEAQLMNFLASKVAPYKTIRQVQFIDAIPKSPTGKILRNKLCAGQNPLRAADAAG